MKLDYEKMYKSTLENNNSYEIVFTPNGCHTIKKDGPVEYIINPVPFARNFLNISGKVAQLSMAIQNSQYDGSDEKYKELLSLFSESE